MNIQSIEDKIKTFLYFSLARSRSNSRVSVFKDLGVPGGTGGVLMTKPILGETQIFGERSKSKEYLFQKRLNVSYKLLFDRFSFIFIIFF